MKSIQPSLSFGREQTKHKYEFEEVCADLEKDFSKAVWSLPYKPYCTEYKLREAGRIARKRGVLKLGYLIGILKKL